MSQGLFHRQSICRGKPILDFVQRTPREYMKHTEIKPLLANISGICFPRLKAVHQDYRVIFTQKSVLKSSKPAPFKAMFITFQQHNMN